MFLTHPVTPPNSVISKEADMPETKKIRSVEASEQTILRSARLCRNAHSFSARALHTHGNILLKYHSWITTERSSRQHLKNSHDLYLFLKVLGSQKNLKHFITF